MPETFRTREGKMHCKCCGREIKLGPYEPIEELMNPWHSTDPGKPCSAGCEKGHMPEKRGHYWHVKRIINCENSYTVEWRFYNGIVWEGFTFGQESRPDYYRIPDGHPPIPEE